MNHRDNNTSTVISEHYTDRFELGQPNEPKQFFPSSPACQENPRILLAPETELGRFTVIEHIDSGNTADIYLARDNVSCKNVAIKVVNAGPCSLGGGGEVLRNEKLLYDKVRDHRHIIKAYDVHSIKWAGTTLALLSMEFADGQSLAQWLGRSEIDPDTDYNWLENFRQCTSAVTALHEAGLHHGDIKPDNFVMVNGNWKLCDLSCASALSADLNHSHDRGDIFRLGGILIMLGGRSNDCNSALDDPTSGNGTTTSNYVRRRLSDIINKCQGKHGQAKYESIHELLRDIDRITNELTSQEHDDNERLWYRACMEIEVGRFDMALSACRTILERDPSYDQAQAMSLELNNRRSRADQIYAYLLNNNMSLDIGRFNALREQAASIYPNHPDALRVRPEVHPHMVLTEGLITKGEAAARSGQWEKALTCFENAMDMAPTSAKASRAVEVMSGIMEQIHSARLQINNAIAQGQNVKAQIIDRAINEYLENIEITF